MYLLVVQDSKKKKRTLGKDFIDRLKELKVNFVVTDSDVYVLVFRYFFSL